MVKYTVRERAYALPLLHAARYPSSEVCGVLLTDKASVDSEKINITTAVPLFHHWTTLSPMLEVALQQVNADAKIVQRSFGCRRLANLRADHRLTCTLPVKILPLLAGMWPTKPLLTKPSMSIPSRRWKRYSSTMRMP